MNTNVIDAVCHETESTETEKKSRRLAGWTLVKVGAGLMAVGAAGLVIVTKMTNSDED